MKNSMQLAIGVLLIATAPARAQWTQFDDPLLPRLIEAAHGVGATLAQAEARIADARAVGVAGDASLLPSLDLSAGADRGRAAPGAPAATSAALGLRAGWELDLFGANRAGADAAQARLAASEAALQGARIALAAEVANTYVGLRACEAQLAYAEFDAGSRAETARLTTLAAGGGMRAPAAADLAGASAAQGRAALTSQRERCGLHVKTLTALTAIDEATLRRDLEQATARVPQPSAPAPGVVSAETLSRRPDLLVAARELVAASADYQQAEARRWPRIALSGSVSAARVSSGGVSTNGSIWSIGPLSVTVPLFDAGARRANAAAALARYQAAGVVYAAGLRDAVRDIESALLASQSAAARGADARNAVDGFERSYWATDALYRGGLASLFELEDARRNMLAANTSLVEQQRDGAIAWISLYRATGGWAFSDFQTQDDE